MSSESVTVSNLEFSFLIYSLELSCDLVFPVEQTSALPQVFGLFSPCPYVGTLHICCQHMGGYTRHDFKLIKFAICAILMPQYKVSFAYQCYRWADNCY